MKNFFTIISLSCLILACGDRDSPRAVAENFLKAISTHDYDGARKYGTEETERFLDMISGFHKMMPDSVNREKKYEITRETMDGDRAVIYFKEQGRPGEQPLPMIKQDGRWKVIKSKESINSADDSNTLDIGATSTDTAQ
jgi:hypothetical protein